MNKKFALMIPVLCVLLVACAGGGGTSGAADVPSDDTGDAAGGAAGGTVPASMTYDILVATLEETGATVEDVGGISQPFLAVQGHAIKVNGADVQIYQYENADVTAEEAMTIPADGASFDTIMVTWVATPHFYISDKLIVLYVGDDAAVITLLESQLGPQFAGG